MKSAILAAASAFAVAAVAAPAAAQSMPGMEMPTPAPTGSADHSHMSGMQMAGTPHSMPMTGALGPYSMNRESSGTAWQPDDSEHAGLMTRSGDLRYRRSACGD